jgi:glycosyltransferase involved in cell wall biosynthesis
MRILVAHNFYQQAGGEDTVVNAEISMLRAHGNDVEIYGRTNEDINEISPVKVAGQTFWSRHTNKDIASLVSNFKPDVIHVHNTFPLISPSIYWAAAKANVPVVQTLHNFRLLCPQAMFLRDGKVCEDCLGNIPWRGIMHGCYRGSKSQTAVLAGMTTAHSIIGTWHNKITRYIALNEFCRQKFIAGGLPAHSIAVKPNFLDAPAIAETARNGFLFVGRLSPEKGICTLAAAAKLLNKASIRVAGIGEQSALLENIAGLDMLGKLPSEVIFNKMAQSSALIMPSIWYENFPRTLVESFAYGLPVIASRIGALSELIEDGVTGLLFEPGNAADLAKKMQWAQQNPEKMRQMGQKAYALYQAKYTPKQNYAQLISIYKDAIKQKLVI